MQLFFHKKPKQIYLDTASATQPSTAVLGNFVQYSRDAYANPHTFHDLGKKSKALFGIARGDIAQMLGVQTKEIYFTSGGTESDNLAVFGVVYAAQKKGIKKPHVIVSAVEHPAVLVPAQVLFEKGEISLSVIPVSRNGIVSVGEIKKAITSDTVLVSVMLVNNETGTRQRVEDIAKMVRHARKHVTKSEYPYLHTDAVQGYYEDLHIPKLGVDMLTLTSGKMYGVRGIGILYKKEYVCIDPMLYGGGQERGVRSGTESAPLVLAFRDALKKRKGIYEIQSERLGLLRKWFEAQLVEHFGVIVHAVNTPRAPHILNATFPGIEAEHLVLYLAAKGIAVSAKSACSSESEEISHVLVAMYGKDMPFSNTEGSIRFSFSAHTTKLDLEYVLKMIKRHVQIQACLVKK